jgi:hypothetical protein
MSERDDASPVGEEYHGWVNYPTWAVHQWLSAEDVNAAAARAILQNADDVHHSAQSLEAWIQAGNPLTEAGTLYGDLLGWALSAVAWVDVAGALGPDEEETPPSYNTP